MHVLYSFKRCPYAMRARMALYLSKIKVEHREVSLKNKPKAMLELSPKGTVPVLLLNDGRVIDESIDIVNWCLEQNIHTFTDELNNEQKSITENEIKLFDEKFKYHLDRYKYATRYKDIDEVAHRDACIEILKSIENKIYNSKWFFSNHINKIDICILPFIRQFRIANTGWFDLNTEIPKTQKWLGNFLESTLLREIMANYDVWEKDSNVNFFPKDL